MLKFDHKNTSNPRQDFLEYMKICAQNITSELSPIPQRGFEECPSPTGLATYLIEWYIVSFYSQEDAFTSKSILTELKRVAIAPLNSIKIVELEAIGVKALSDETLTEEYIEEIRFRAVQYIFFMSLVSGNETILLDTLNELYSNRVISPKNFAIMIRSLIVSFETYLQTEEIQKGRNKDFREAIETRLDAIYEMYIKER